MEEEGRYRNNILNDIDDHEITNAMVKIKYANIKSCFHRFLIIFCLLAIFVSLYFLQKSQFFFSLVIVLSISILHFKSDILDEVDEVIKRND